MAEYAARTKEGKCIFCELAKGNVEFAGTFWSDKKYIAFLSGWPNTEGFAVIIPRKHYGSDVLAMPDKELREFIVVAKKVSKSLMAHFKDVGRVGLMMEGMGIDHAHIKLFPMHGTAHLRSDKWKQVNSDNDAFYKTYPGFISSNDGPRADDKKLRALASKLRKVSP